MKRKRSLKKTLRRLRPKLIVVLVICALASVGAGWWFFQKNSSPAPSYTGPIEHLSTGIVGEYSSLSIIAQEKGYFKASGLDVEIKDYISGPPAVVDMLAGNVDIVTGADFVGVRNGFDRPDLRIIAKQARADSFFWVVRTDHGILNPEDLRGKRVGITRKTAGEFYLGQYLTLNELSLNDIVLSDMPPDKLVEALELGTLDAIVTFNPHISTLQSKLESKVSVWPLQGDQRLSTLLYATDKLTTQRSEAVKRYLRALVMAEEYAQIYNDDARQLVGDYLKFDDDYMQTVWSNISFDISLDQDLLISMEDQARWTIENKITESTTVPDYLKMIYFNGLEQVKPDSITIIR